MKNFLKKAIIAMLPLLGGTVLLSSCEESDNWQPGEAVGKDAPVVYFSSGNPATIINLGEESSSFNLTLERLNTEGQLTVPIVVTGKTGEINVPESVTFQDGESVTKLNVSYIYSSGMLLSLSIGNGYGNPYLEQNGTLSYSCSVSRLNRICRVKYRDDSTLGGVQSYIYSYEGINRFVFTNFMDSGIDVTFTVDTKHSGGTFNPEDLSSLKGDFVPQDNLYYDGSGWYLYDDESEDYPSWTPSGWDKEVLYYYYYGYSDDYNYSYSYIDFSKKKSSYFYGSSFFFDEDFSDYISPAIYYTLDFNSETAPNE